MVLGNCGVDGVMAGVRHFWCSIELWGEPAWLGEVQDRIVEWHKRIPFIYKKYNIYLNFISGNILFCAVFVQYRVTCVSIDL